MTIREEWITVAQKLTDASKDQIGIALPGKQGSFDTDQFYMTLAFQAGARLADADGDPSFDTPEHLKALEFTGLSEALHFHNRVQPHLTRFVGLGNFVQAASDFEAWLALRTSAMVVLGIVSLSYSLGLLTGVLLNQKMRLRGVYRAIILTPWVVPPVVSFISWQWMLADQDGVVNRTLLALGLVRERVMWLADPTLAMLCLMVVGVWTRFPFMMITVLAALANISDDIYEAGQVDGASRFQLFRYITFPLIMPVSVTATLLQAIWTFNDFGLPFVLTGGGPANATTTMILLAYKQAFLQFNIGYGTALAVVSMVMMLGLGSIYLRLQAQRGVYQ